MKLRLTLFFLILLLYNTIQHAKAAEEISFRNHQIPGCNTVSSFAQDDEGLIWIGTLDNGLYCYNGYNSFPRAHMSSSSPHSVFDLSIVGDSIYMACDKGIAIFNRRTLVYHYPIQPHITNARTIVKHDNRLYFGADQGLYCYTPNSGKVDIINNKITDIYSIVSTHKGLLVGTLYGLYFVNGKSFHEIPVAGQRKSYISAIISDRNVKDKYWIWAFGRFFAYNASNNEFSEELLLRNISIKTLAQDKKGRLYIGTDNGLYIKSDSDILHLYHDSKDSRSIPNNIIWRTFLDCNDNLWLGTDNGFSTSAHHPLFKYNSIFQMTGYTTGNYIENVFEDSEHTLWIGGSSGLIRYPIDGNWTWYRDGNPQYPITHNRVRSFFEDREHNIWISTDLGINLYLSSTRQLRNIVVTDSNHHYTARWAYGMTEDEHGRLWIASYNGLYIISKKRLLSSNDKEIEADIVLMPETHFSHIALDKQGQIWATSSQGLMRINTIDCKVHNVMKDNIDAMTIVNQNEIWVASSGRFLHFATDGKKIDELRYGTSKEKILTINSVGNQLWAISQNEYRIIKNSKEIELYKIPFYAATSGLYSPNTKRFYIGSIDGLMILDPTSIDKRHDSAQLVLSEILVNEQQLSDQPNRTLNKNIKLSFDENNLVFMFSDLPYLNKVQHLYAYKLEGVDNSWQRLNSETYQVSYNGLPYGNYTLQVFTIDGFGNIKDEVYSLEIDIFPPWYLMWWMKLLYFILIVGLAYLVIHYYMVRRRLRQEHEAKVKIMQESQSRISYYQYIYSEIRVSLGSIMNPMIQLLGSNPKKEMLHHLEEIRHESTRLNSLIREASEASTSNKFTSNDTLLDIVELSHQMVDEMKSEGAKKDIKLTFSSFTPHLYEKSDITEVNSLYCILLGYVIQHSESGGSVNISINYLSSNKKLIITAKSNTMHIPSEICPFLFQRYALQMPDAPDDYTPMLYMISQYVEKYSGSIGVVQANDGDAFVIQIPIDINEEILESNKLEVDDINSDNEIHTSTEKSTINSKSDERLLLEAISIIGEHISDSDFNVSKLQQALGIGDKMLYRKIKYMTGLTPVEYIRDIRMKRASILLRGGQFSVSEVMYMVGFSNTGYFSKCFTNAFGVTPTQYIRSNYNNNDN
ncbi:two-component regulator propeller domain-containing protein [Phocaeicola paurosaccharolyticus]|uniref:two-component regulator propeller domain-containing protein n=1 Tax=Phocaeicola paurosaccharolyticus TaxID=732242 RepID=UPI00046AE05A|nr:two-component regulator propeller domain-containing protein [Phocaeicola paurosaccharolyticus]